MRPLQNKICFIGHRGVGKSTLLKRLKKNSELTDYDFFDLDEQIEALANKTIKEIFEDSGEAEFRRIEMYVSQKIFNHPTKAMVAVGAGFDVLKIPTDWHVIWVRRRSDDLGRVFLDRPRLLKEIDPIEEYFKKKNQRDPYFKKSADQCMWLCEGDFLETEKNLLDFIKGTSMVRGASITISAQEAEDIQHFWTLRSDWGFQFFELRDDLLSYEQIHKVLSVLPLDSVLFAFRNQAKMDRSQEIVLKTGLKFDWPVEFGFCDFAVPFVLSKHSALRTKVTLDFDDLKSAQRQYSSRPHLKLAKRIDHFGDLLLAHEWSIQEQASFLPMSDDGRWIWYRLWRGESQRLNFVFEKQASSVDQPNLSEWNRFRTLGPKPKNFSAVLGSPVSYSFSPVFHHNFLKNNFDFCMFPIKMDVEDLRQEAFSVLCQLGLKIAAITSPIKKAVMNIVKNAKFSSDVIELDSTNTFFVSEDNICFFENTDTMGFAKMWQEFQEQNKTLPKNVVVWGGGGVLGPIKRAIPEAILYSVRTARPRDVQGSPPELPPNVLIWASGTLDSLVNLPKSWKPTWVIDLSYLDVSPAKVYALLHGVNYVSGLTMFKAQARAQQQFWGEFL